MTHEPTPIKDAFEEWLLRDQLRVFAEAALAALAIHVFADVLGVMWLAAGAGVGCLVFGLVAVAGYGWRRFKRWRYPTYYKVEEGD